MLRLPMLQSSRLPVTQHGRKELFRGNSKSLHRFSQAIRLPIYRSYTVAPLLHTYRHLSRIQVALIKRSNSLTPNSYTIFYQIRAYFNPPPQYPQYQTPGARYHPARRVFRAVRFVAVNFLLWAIFTSITVFVVGRHAADVLGNIELVRWIKAHHANGHPIYYVEDAKSFSAVGPGEQVDVESALIFLLSLFVRLCDRDPKERESGWHYLRLFSNGKRKIAEDLDVPIFEVDPFAKVIELRGKAERSLDPSVWDMEIEFELEKAMDEYSNALQRIGWQPTKNADGSRSLTRGVRVEDGRRCMSYISYLPGFALLTLSKFQKLRKTETEHAFVHHK